MSVEISTTGRFAIRWVQPVLFSLFFYVWYSMSKRWHKAGDPDRVLGVGAFLGIMTVFPISMHTSISALEGRVSTLTRPRHARTRLLGLVCPVQFMLDCSPQGCLRPKAYSTRWDRSKLSIRPMYIDHHATICDTMRKRWAFLFNKYKRSMYWAEHSLSHEKFRSRRPAFS